MMSHSEYYNTAMVNAGIAHGQHREIIGGLWEEMGDHQLTFLIAQGLRPDHRLLDVGCGSLRLGVRAIPYLQPDGYFGSDLSETLVRSGYDKELDDEGRDRTPWSHFGFNDDFDFTFIDQSIDFAIAQSVFTHLPLNHLRRCLANLAPKMAKDGRFYATYFGCPVEADLFLPFVQPHAGVVTHDYRDPYHYRESDLDWAVNAHDWRVEPIGDWGHPRGQRIIAYVRR